MGSSTMAGGSAKKNNEANASTLQFRGYAMASVGGIYLAWRVGYHWDSFGTWCGVMFALVLGALYASWSMFKATADGGLYDLTDDKISQVWFDLFYVSLTVLLLAT